MLEKNKFYYYSKYPLRGKANSNFKNLRNWTKFTDPLPFATEKQYPFKVSGKLDTNRSIQSNNTDRNKIWKRKDFLKLTSKNWIQLSIGIVITSSFHVIKENIPYTIKNERSRYTEEACNKRGTRTAGMGHFSQNAR